MANCINNYGVEFLLEDDTIDRFIGYLVTNGKAIRGYYGCTSFFNKLGNIDFYTKTKKLENGNFEAIGLDTHTGGEFVWEMRSNDIELTQNKEIHMERVFMMQKVSGDSGMIPIHIINADVLPSFLEDDIIKLQMTALPLKINYYADEDAYADAQPETKDGKKWLVANGALFPSAFLINHSVENQNNVDFSTDDMALFNATVKALYWGTFELEGDKSNTFIRCIAETEYGEIEFCHALDQVPKDMHDNLKVGAIISGICILSGDAAIYEYEDGFVKDFDNNLKLLKFAIASGENERLRNVLSENAQYVSESANKTFVGADDIIARLNEVSECKTSFAQTATLTEAEADMDYPIGTRCVVISHNEKDNYRTIAFIDVNSDGEIERIYTSIDTRYHFKIDDPPKTSGLLDDIKIPDSVVEPIVSRAKFEGMIDRDMDANQLMQNISHLSTLKNNIKNMLEYLKDNHQPDIIEAIENLFGYLFAKAIEQTINENASKENLIPCLTASFSPADAFNRNLCTTFDGEMHEKLVTDMKKGKLFANDFHLYMQLNDLTDESFTEEITKALVAVQGIGQLYAKQFKNN